MDIKKTLIGLVAAAILAIAAYLTQIATKLETDHGIAPAAITAPVPVIATPTSSESTSSSEAPITGQLGPSD